MLNVKEYIRIFSHIVWPQTCPVCGRVAVPFCQSCLESVVDPLPLFCLECGGAYGVKCCASSAPCFALTEHAGYAREFLLRLKYHNVKSLGLPMGRLIGKHMFPERFDMVLPIPLHADSVREYNQTELLARGIGEIISTPVNSSALFWRKNCGKQTGRTGRERSSMLYDSMSASTDVKDKHVLLVDDVYTTGGTLRAAKSAVETSGGIVAGAALWSRRISSNEPFESWDITIED